MEFFGLDIGSYNIKAVQLKKNKDKYQLVAFGSVPFTKKGILSESESDLQELAETIKKLCQDVGIKTKNVAIALPQDQVFTRTVIFPSLSDEELKSALEWEAEQYIPLPLSEVFTAYEVIGKIKENGSEKIEVLLAAAPKSLVEKMIRVLKIAGLNPVSIEMEIMSIARSLASSSNESVLVIDFGAKATDLAIVENEKIVLIHSVSIGGEALTRAISLELGLEFNQSEAYKTSYGMDTEKLEGKVSSAIKPILSNIVSEIAKIIHFYQEKNGNIKRIIITGGSAALPELNTFLAEKLNLEIQIGDPFSQVIKNDLAAKITSSDLPLYSVAVGLAMKEI